MFWEKKNKQKTKNNNNNKKTTDSDICSLLDRKRPPRPHQPCRAADNKKKNKKHASVRKLNGINTETTYFNSQLWALLTGTSGFSKELNDIPGLNTKTFLLQSQYTINYTCNYNLIYSTSTRIDRNIIDILQILPKSGKYH